MFWSELTWEEIPKVLKAVNYAAILPVGATEQHGPHLGCGVDTAIADLLCTEVSKRTQVPMLPTLPYGCSIGHSKHWPGTIAIQPITLIEIIKQIGDWAYSSGVRRLFIVNAHVTNAAPLRCALEMLRASYDDLMISIVHSAQLSPRVREFHFSDAEDWHANDAETSLMMSHAPSLFRAEKLNIADDPDRTEGLLFSHPVNHTSKNGVTGQPSLASENKGIQGFEWMVEDLTQIILKGLDEVPPLDTHYCSH
ncbi:creatininase family protein [Acinetobacter terrae]|uniref:Creatininase family protein n=1 Tax=Acinetobacter terrae TaxID=2731247 RepID=A0A4R0EL36_9GAMM|nr:creatininase family protein [Acinetobacter terrae]TCB58197.1 creatininase family protein [Acinetobacter terrae]